MNCARCHAALPEGANFCPRCGKRQRQTAPPSKQSRHRRQKGTGTVYKDKRNTNRPYVAITASGVRVGSFASPAEAVKRLDDVNAMMIAPERQNYTLADVYERWSRLHFPKVTVSAQNSYKNAYKKAAALQGRRMMSLKTEDYQGIIDEMVAAKASRSLCEKQRQLFSQLCQYAINQDIIHTNYATALVLPDPPDAKTRVLSNEEISAISSMAQDKRLGETARIALVLIYTGMRLNELLTIRRQNVDLQAGTMTGGEKTEAGRNRVIPIHPDIMPYIQSWMYENETDFLIPSKYGIPRDHNNVRKSFNSLMTKLGIKGVTPHTCRHTAATKMAAAGIPPEVTKQILGHADITTTLNIYTHPDIDLLKENIQKLSFNLNA